MTNTGHTSLPKPLAFKTNQEHHSHTLPFVDFCPMKQGMSFWNVPKTGGFYGGVTTGSALAKIYIKHLIDGSYEDEGGLLQLIAKDMSKTVCVNTEEQRAINGQITGFFREIEQFMKYVGFISDGNLNRFDRASNLEAANLGINFDESQLAKKYS